MTSLYLSEKPSQINKDLIRYLDTNLQSIVKMGLFITFTVAGSDESEFYSKKGIVNFPTLSHNNSRHIGLDKIKAFFNTCHQQYKKNQTSRTENDDITDYWSSVLAKGDEEEGGGDEDGEGMKSRAQQVVNERQEKISQRKPKPGNSSPAPPGPSRQPEPVPDRSAQPMMKGAVSTKKSPPPKMVGSARKGNVEPSTVDVFRSLDSSGEEAMDDKLMAKFFESRVETDM